MSHAASRHYYSKKQLGSRDFCHLKTLLPAYSLMKKTLYFLTWRFSFLLGDLPFSRVYCKPPYFQQASQKPVNSTVANLGLPEINTMFWDNKYIRTLMSLGLFSGSGKQ